MQVNSQTFHFAEPFISPSISQFFHRSPGEKTILSQMINEWNERTCISNISQKWRKDRPDSEEAKSNLLILLYNVECLNTRDTEMFELLSQNNPHICILTGVGNATNNLPCFPGYTGIGQVGTNAFGGVAILYQSALKCEIIDKEFNFILSQFEINKESVLIGAIYVPPKTLPPLQLFNKCKNKPFYIFGDFNAKHTTWKCEKNNTSGTHMFQWMEATGNEMITPNKAISKRSNAIIDFAVTHDAEDWNKQMKLRKSRVVMKSLPIF